MDSKEMKELALSKVLLLALAVLGLVIVIWLAWIRPTPHATPDTRTETAQPAPAPAPSVAPQVAGVKAGETPQLLLTEWGVRAPLTQDTYDMTYTFTKNDTEFATFTFKRLQDVGICNPSVGVSMTRSTTKNDPPYDITNPEPIAQVGQHFYYLAYSGEPCTVMATAEQEAVAKSINGGDLHAAVRSVLQKLQIQ